MASKGKNGSRKMSSAAHGTKRAKGRKRQQAQKTPEFSASPSPDLERANGRKRQQAQKTPEFIASPSPDPEEPAELKLETDPVLGKIKVYSSAPDGIYLMPGSDEYIVARVVVAFASVWNTNENHTEWLVLVEWMGDDDDAKSCKMSWMPAKDMVPGALNSFWSNVHPACLPEVPKFPYDSRVYPSEAYIADALQAAAVQRFGDAKEAFAWLQSHAGYPFSECYEGFKTPLPVVGTDLYSGDPILEIPDVPKVSLTMAEQKTNHDALSKGTIPPALAFGPDPANTAQFAEQKPASSNKVPPASAGSDAANAAVSSSVDNEEEHDDNTDSAETDALRNFSTDKGNFEMSSQAVTVPATGSGASSSNDVENGAPMAAVADSQHNADDGSVAPAATPHPAALRLEDILVSDIGLDSDQDSAKPRGVKRKATGAFGMSGRAARPNMGNEHAGTFNMDTSS